MAKLDWEAHKYRKRARPLLTEGEIKDMKLKAQQMADRVSKGHRSPQAHKHGAVKVYTPDELAAWAAQNDLTVRGGR